MDRKRLRIRSLYEAISPHYQALYGEEQRAKQNRVMQMAEIKSAERVLDAGCGTGGLALKLSRRARLVIALDFSSSMARASKKLCRNEPRCEVVNADAENLPFQPSSFDAFVAVTAFLDSKTAESVMGDVKRVLAEHGVAFSSIPAKGRESKRTLMDIEKCFHGWSLRRVRLDKDVGILAINTTDSKSHG